MKGIVVHHKGKIWRSLEGRVSSGRLTIKAITSLPSTMEGRDRGSVERPVYFVFTVDGRTFAASQNVTLRKGRRYPNIEHWFFVSESVQHLELNELREPSAVPV